MARPSKFTPETRQRILDLIKAGNFAARSAAAAGVSETTYYRWLTDGEQADEKAQALDDKVNAWNQLSSGQQRRKANRHLQPGEDDYLTEDEATKREFWEAVKRAESEAQATAVALITRAARDKWQAAAWYLERKFPEEWGRKDTHRIDADVRSRQLVSTVDPEQMSAEELDAFIEGRDLDED